MWAAIWSFFGDVRAEGYSAAFQLAGVVGAAVAFGYARRPLVVAKLRLRSVVDFEIENISRATAHRVSVEVSCDEPFARRGTEIGCVWKWELADMAPGQRYGSYAIGQEHFNAGVLVTVRWKGRGLLRLFPLRRKYKFGGPELLDGAVLMGRTAVQSGSVITQDQDAQAIVTAIRDHTRAVIDYSD